MLLSLFLALPVRGESIVVDNAIPAVQPTPYELVQKYFPNNYEVMWKVFGCESGHRQFKEDGTTLMSPTSDSGFAQINWVHDVEAKKLGLDYKNSLEDNIKMARVIYDKQGIGAWVCADKLGII